MHLEKPLWIHAVSLGEAIMVKGLIDALRQAYPHRCMIFTTVTPTGNKIVSSWARARDAVVYLPFDFSFIVERFLRRVDPSVCVIAETELWPNLIRQLHRRKIPVVIVNGRISDTSWSGYRFIKPFIRPILRKVNYFCVQTPTDGERLKVLGAREDQVKVTGNMKFDIPLLKPDPHELDLCRRSLGLAPGDKLLVCGSTHPGEEESLVQAYKDLQREFPYLKLLVAPRHPERSPQIKEIVSHAGFHGIFVSKLPFECPTCMTRPVYILDSIGKLIFYYAVADIVFVGGSFIKKGGHNILEPASLQKPILYGPSMFNFRDISALFIREKGALQVEGPQELVMQIAVLLKDPSQAVRLGARAQELIMKNTGATQKNLEVIRELL
ncbi:MAG: 3-deoxy-D-manno-octulosonic acid transferase [Candidatus Omnitrophica bacterium]|nr:3-deoxy-D-manno-octulosonic acid transferase [Candidatus Omnitrophota bacterium]